MPDITILIPPSEGKMSGGEFPPLNHLPSDTAPMIDKLRNISEGDWSGILGVSGAALEKAVLTNKTILSAKTTAAIKRYNGVVYKALDYENLNKKAQEFCDKHVRIVSAVFGLVAPTDLIPEYKLKIDKLEAAKHWLPVITDALKKTYVIDLLPQAHQKAVSYKKGIKVEFFIVKNGQTVPAGHAGKHIKGRFVRWLCEKHITDPKQFKSFKEEGFQWKDGVFIKNT